MRKIISIAKEFSDAPGGRFIKDGKYSGEEFRHSFLEPAFKDENITDVEIDLDGTFGYGISFLEEAFGGLARIFGSECVIKKIHFVSRENPSLINKIHSYIRDCAE